MRARVAWVVVAGAAACADACLPRDLTYARESDASTTCVPDASTPCYTGPEETRDVGACRSGQSVCSADGAEVGECTGEVLPALDDCVTPEDEDCDGESAACTGKGIWGKVIGGPTNDTAAALVAVGGDVVVVGAKDGSTDPTDGDPDGVGFAARLRPGGDQVWMATWSKMGGPSLATAVVAAPDDGVIVVGNFTGTADFGDGPVDADGVDVFVVALDSEGELLWKRAFGGPGTQAAADLALAPDGSIYLAGWFAGSAKFGASEFTGSGYVDGYVLRLAPGGKPDTAVQIPGDAAVLTALALAPDGRVVVAGLFGGALFFGAERLASAGGQDALVAALDPDLAPLWARQFGDDLEQQAWDIVVDAEGDALAVGSFAGTIGLGGRALTATGIDGFIAIVDADGEEVEGAAFAGSGDEHARGVALDGFGNRIVTGSFDTDVELGGDVLASEGGTDGFAVKLDPAGAAVWQRSFGPAEQQMGLAVACDDGAVYLAGVTSADVDLGPYATPPLGGWDAWVTAVEP